jgi:hypothetical protein
MARFSSYLSIFLFSFVVLGRVAFPSSNLIVRAQDDDEDEFEAPASSGSASGSGSLVVSKSLDQEHIAQGQDIVVDITLFNVGDGPAFEVSLDDDLSSSSAIKLISGETSKTWGEIPAGENVTHSYTVSVVSYGKVNINAASVSYKSSPTANTITAKSSVPLLSEGPGTGDILAADEFARNHGTHTVEIAVLSLICVALVAFPYKSKIDAEEVIFKKEDSKKDKKKN